MIDSLDQYWTVNDKKLYGGDEYYRNHTVDVRDFYTVGLKVSILATLSVLLFGVLMCIF